MKNLGFGSVALIALAAAGPVCAADMPVKAPPVVEVAVYNWNGCYIGAHIGGGWARTDATTFPAGTIAGGSETHSYNFRGGSALGGGHAGCNWQDGSRKFLFGVEVDGTWTRIRDSATGIPADGGVPFTAATEPISRDVN